jgi:hypothetical protein
MYLHQRPSAANGAGRRELYLTPRNPLQSMQTNGLSLPQHVHLIVAQTMEVPSRRRSVSIFLECPCGPCPCTVLKPHTVTGIPIGRQRSRNESEGMDYNEGHRFLGGARDPWEKGSKTTTCYCANPSGRVRGQWIGTTCC